ncbi:preprotein translocase subunit SecG [Candidatus Dependentiae bacterium]|nr:preprotein translocase subunit SecG [Candidatus Dependentiae bacterium]
MIFFTIFSFLFSILCLFIILMVLIQRGKGNMGLGNIGGNNQMLFGTSGQDIFQKITWICCVLLLVSSFVLAFVKAKQVGYKPRSYQQPISREDLSFPSE